MDVFAFPLNLDDTNRGFKKVEQGSDVQKAQTISLFLQTLQGERPVLNQYGTEDFLFQGVSDADEIAGGFTEWHEAEEVELEEIEVVEIEGVIAEINVTFS